MAKKILVVDDSALVRKQLGTLLEEEGYEVDFAKNGQVACDKAIETQYNAITMDINMPVMDGITAVKNIMKEAPTPIVMVSSLTTEDARPTMEALELGAIDCVAKPGTSNLGLRNTADDILTYVKNASRIPRRRLQRRIQEATRSLERKRVRKDVSQEKVQSSKSATKVVLIGSSTGGPGLLEEICASLPADFPYAVCIVQHMPEKFTAAFAQRLDRASKLPVFEAQNNQELLESTVYLAKGGKHLHFRKKVSGKIVLRLEDSNEKRFFTPSVDEMYFSALEVFDPKNILGVILTGIGDDGADGMVALKKAGVHTLAESEETACVYGMPKEAYLRGGVSEKLPFEKIVEKISRYR
jgi:two-component system chemotaxis response regulator CheB